MRLETKKAFFDEPLYLESGRILQPFEVMYETYGELNEDKSNVIVITHALSGSHHAAGKYEGESKAGWWDGLIGDGKTVDTTKYFVICMNNIGSCFGSTNPMSIEPSKAKPYRFRFPVLTITDIVKAQVRVLKSLGIEKLHAVIGGSMGGMQALCYAIEYPTLAKHIIALATTAYTRPWAIAYNKVAVEAIRNDPAFKDGEYLVAYDPLDGSSLVDVNLSVGSIYGIYKNDFTASNIVASVYVVFGPRVELVIADGESVKMYRLMDGEFTYIQDIKLEQKGKLQAPGSTQQCWYPYHKQMIDGFFAEGYRLRYSGGMVPDLHQILLKGGGLFSYPGTSDKPKGKLRQLFEVFPFAFVYNAAGGKAIDGYDDVLKVETTHIHDTTPCFFGSNYEINRVLEVYGQNK
jgi:fructose-1,6-bisphosphatase I